MIDLATYIGKKLALIIIDMQNDFISEGGSIKCVGSEQIVPLIQGLKQLSKKKGIPVITTQEQHRRSGIDLGRERDNEIHEHCMEGSWGEKMIQGMEPEDSDYHIVKRRYSAFMGTELEIILKGMGIETLIITGVATDACVGATCMDAQQLDYKVVVPKECAASTSQDQHEAFLKHIGRILGRVVPLEELQRVLEVI